MEGEVVKLYLYSSLLHLVSGLTIMLPLHLPLASAAMHRYSKTKFQRPGARPEAIWVWTDSFDLRGAVRGDVNSWILGRAKNDGGGLCALFQCLRSRAARCRAWMMVRERPAHDLVWAVVDWKLRSSLGTELYSNSMTCIGRLITGSNLSSDA